LGRRVKWTGEEGTVDGRAQPDRALGTVDRVWGWGAGKKRVAGIGCEAVIEIFFCLCSMRDF